MICPFSVNLLHSHDITTLKRANSFKLKWRAAKSNYDNNQDAFFFFTCQTVESNMYFKNGPFLKKNIIEMFSVFNLK